MKRLALLGVSVLSALLLALPALAQVPPPLGQAAVTAVNVLSGDRPAEPGYEWGTQLSVTLQATVNTDNQALFTDLVYGFAVNNPANNFPFPRLVAEFTGPDVSGGARWRGWLNQRDAGTYVERCAVTADAAGASTDYVAFSSARDEPNGEIYFAEWSAGSPTRVTNRPAFADREPTLSPGALRIAFTSSLPGGPGDIFTVRRDGSRLTNLTNSPADDRNPAWSPGATKIAFSSNMTGDYEIYRMNTDGTGLENLSNMPGSNEYEPAWKQGGQYIAFASDATDPSDGSTDFDIWVLDIFGVDPTWNVTGVEDTTFGADYSPSWSPEQVSPGSWGLAFVSERDGNQEIYRMDVDFTTQTASGSTPMTIDLAKDTNPKWYRDKDGNERILFDREDIVTGDWAIYALNPADPNPSTTAAPIAQNSSLWDGEADFATMTPRVLTLQWPATGAYTLKPYKGPDRMWGAYNISERADNRFGAVGEWKITRLSLRLILDSGQEWLDYNGDPGNPANPFPIGDPAPIATSRVAFGSGRDGNPEIYITDAVGRDVDLNGLNQKRLTFNPANDTDPSLSPNSLQVAFVSDRDGNSEIYLMNSDGTRQKNLTAAALDANGLPAQDLDPCWSPNGRRIAFASNRNANPAIFEIWVMDADGSNPIQITTIGADSHSPTWSPDGSWLAFASDADLDWDIYKVEIGNPASLVNLTNANDPTNAADTSPAWSPVGGQIAFTTTRVAEPRIFTMAEDGSSPTILTMGGGVVGDDHGAWDRSGEHLVFQRDTGTGFDLWVRFPEGWYKAIVTDPAADVTPSWSATDGFCFDINNPLALAQWDGTGWREITDPLWDTYAVANLPVNGNVTILPDLLIPLSPHGATEPIAGTATVRNRSFLALTPSSDDAASPLVRFDVGDVRFQPPRQFVPLPPSSSPEFPPLPGQALALTSLIPSQTVTVPATFQWPPEGRTSVFLTVGQRFQVDAWGRWTSGGLPYGPEGNGPSGAGFILPSAPAFSLIGRIDPGGLPFFVGSSFSGLATIPGALWLGMNDAPGPGGFGDNSGQVTATLSAGGPAQLAQEGISLASGEILPRPTASITPPENQPPAPFGYTASNPRFSGLFSPSYLFNPLDSLGRWFTRALPSPPEAVPGLQVALSDIMPYLAFFYVDVNHNQALDRAGKTRIAFCSNRDGNYEIYVMNADGTAPVRLTNNPAGDFEPDCSPDGSKIAFASDRDGNAEVYVMNSDGTNQANLTNNPAADFDPDWSPNGSKIAFVSNREGNEDIYVMNADGTGQTDLTSNNPETDHNPCWSPDGTRIAFGSSRGGIPGEVYVMNSDGTSQTRLTTDGAISEHAAWSPDGKKIAYMSWRLVGPEVWVMNSDGTNHVNLTNNPAAWDEQPCWSPDGSKIAFVSRAGGAGGNAEVCVMNADGSNQTNLTRNPGLDWGPSWGPPALGALFEEPYRAFEVTVGVPADHRVRIAEESVDLGQVKPGEAYVRGVGGVATPYALPSYTKILSLTVENVGNVDLGALNAQITSLTSDDTPKAVNTRLAAVLGAADVTMTVEDATRFPASGLVLVDAEQIYYSSVTINPDPAFDTLNGLTRGMNGTTRAAHFVLPLPAHVSYNAPPPGASLQATVLQTWLGASPAYPITDPGDPTGHSLPKTLVNEEALADGTVGGLATPATVPLAIAIDAVSTSGLEVASVAGFPSSGYVQVGLERIRYVGLGAGPPEAFLNLTRGALGTTAAAHVVGDAVTLVGSLNARISVFVPPDQPAGVYRGNLWVTWWDPIAGQWVRITDKPIDVKLTVTEADAPGVNSPYADITPGLFRYYNTSSGTPKQELSLLWSSNRNDIALGGSGLNFDIFAVVAPWDDTTIPLRPLFSPGPATLFAGKPLDIQPAGTTWIGNFGLLEPFVSDPVNIFGGDPDGWYLTYYQNLYPSFAYDMAGNPWIFWQLNTWWEHRINVGTPAEAVDGRQFRCYLGQAWYDPALPGYRISYLTQNTGPGVTATIYHEQPLTFSEIGSNNVWSFWNNGLESDRWLYLNYYAFTAGVGFALPAEDKPLWPMSKWTSAGERVCALEYAIDPTVFDDSTSVPGQYWGVLFSGFSKLGRDEDIFYMRLYRDALRLPYPGGYDPRQIWSAAVSGRVPFETQNELLQPLPSSAVKDAAGSTHYKVYAATHPDWWVNDGLLNPFDPLSPVYPTDPTVYLNGVELTGGAGFTGTAQGDFTYTYTDPVTLIDIKVTVDPAAGTVRFENDDPAITNPISLPGPAEEVSVIYTPLVKRLTTDKANDNSPIVTLDIVPTPDAGNGSRRRLSLFWRRSVPGQDPSLHFKTYSYDANVASPTYTQWVQDPGNLSPFHRDVSDALIPLSGLTDESQIFAFPNWNSAGTYADRWWLLWTSTHEKTLSTFEPFGATFVYPYASNWDIHYTTFWPSSQPEVSIPPP